MNLIEQVAELNKLERQATPGDWFSHDEYISTRDEIDIDGEGDRRIDIPYDSYDTEFIANIRNIAPDMLATLGKIQPGDADEIDYAIQELRRIFGPDNVAETVEVLRRYQAIAEQMEEERK